MNVTRKRGLYSVVMPLAQALTPSDSWNEGGELETMRREIALQADIIGRLLAFAV